LLTSLRYKYGRTRAIRENTYLPGLEHEPRAENGAGQLRAKQPSMGLMAMSANQLTGTAAAGGMPRQIDLNHPPRRRQGTTASPEGKGAAPAALAQPLRRVTPCNPDAGWWWRRFLCRYSVFDIMSALRTKARIVTIYLVSMLLQK
jgi:hypothetical protein